MCHVLTIPWATGETLQSLLLGCELGTLTKDKGGCWTQS